MRITLTTVLIAANVIAYAWESSTGGGTDFDHGWLSPEDVLRYGEWWRVFTAAFLHANIAHIGLNMLALYSVGTEVEAIYGKTRFTLLYVLAIVGSGLAVVYFAPFRQPGLGASGAVYGLFSALVAVGLRVGKPGRAMIMNVVPVIAINLVFTFSIPGISWEAHVGGLITGFLAALVLFMGARTRRVAFAYAKAYAERAAAPPVNTIRRAPKAETQPPPEIETIEHPPDAGPHEEADAPPLHVRDPRE